MTQVICYNRRQSLANDCTNRTPFVLFVRFPHQGRGACAEAGTSEEAGHRIPNNNHSSRMKTTVAVTIFLSAFLLFQAELIVGKELLPWFGGAPAVWTTCLVFFQVVLLAGYGYAHMVVGKLGVRRQIFVHLALVSLSVMLLAGLALRWPSPITPGLEWRPAGSADPVGQIALLLSVSLGVPFFLLSTTGPLLQGWSVIADPGGSPYRLYALSNAGSLVGLLGYPFLVEPFLGLHVQAVAWSLLYILFALSLFVCAAGLRKTYRGRPGGLPERGDADVTAAPRAGNRVLWMGLAGVPSALLLSTTNHMCQDTAVVPLLWVLPLSLYLASFILCFRYEALYRRWLFPPLYCACLVYAVVNLFAGLEVPLLLQIGVDSLVLFSGCMVCHGELARAKPAVAHLTGFYLAVAAGGALGALCVAVAAPRFFNGFWEYHVSLWGTGALFVAALFADPRSFLRKRPLLISSALGLLLAGLGGVLIWQAVEAAEGSRFTTRNFYGLLRVIEDRDAHFIKLLHGRITHGFQFTDSAREVTPTSYYSRESGVGLAIDTRPARKRGIRIGAVGMGVGTLAAYCGENDTIRFYEINPAVPLLSRRRDPFFTYIEHCRGHVEVAMGDARLSLEAELARGEVGRFDVLALDAFSSDAIPVHLLTEEAFGIYIRHLRTPGGILAVHISNRYIDLVPVVHGYAERHGLASAMISSEEDSVGGWASDWILIADSAGTLDRDPIEGATTSWDSTTYRPVRPWTDDYSNLISLLRKAEE